VGGALWGRGGAGWRARVRVQGGGRGARGGVCWSSAGTAGWPGLCKDVDRVGGGCWRRAVQDGPALWVP
jgi:hypothetical protein